MEISLVKYVEDLKLLKPSTSPITLVNYQNALKATDISTITLDKLNDVWVNLLQKLEVGISYGFIEQTVIVIRGALKVHGVVWAKDYNFNLLIAKLNQKHGIRDAYSEPSLRAILPKIQKYPSVLRLALLCIYSGLRISACQNLRYDAFEKVSGYDIHVFTVKSKGKIYTAAIAEHVFALLKQISYDSPEYVVKPAINTTTRFDILQRQKLIEALKREGLLGYLKDKSPFHSMRHFFAQQIASAGLHAEDIALLMGHNLPNTTAFRVYVDKNELHERIAKAYTKTPLMTLDFFKPLEVAV